MQCILFLESLHDSSQMIGAGSGSGVEHVQVFMGTGLSQNGADYSMRLALQTNHMNPTRHSHLGLI